MKKWEMFRKKQESAHEKREMFRKKQESAHEKVGNVQEKAGKCS